MTLEQYLAHVERQDGYCFNCQSWTMLGDMPAEEQEKLCPLCLTYCLCGAESNHVIDQLSEKLR